VPPAAAGGAAGLASQIASFTCTICPVTAVNCRQAATSRATLPGPAADSCRERVFPPAARARKYRGPVPGMIRLSARTLRLASAATSG
jgi:hypothetical protein